MIFLDTDILSYLLSGDTAIHKKVAESLKIGEQIALTSINVYETLKGLRYRNNQNKEIQFKKFLTKIIVYSLDDNAVSEAANIYAELRKRGNIIGDADILIAAIVKNNSGTLISNNIKHYQFIKGLNLINWK
jgi:tRNA(fMet)-specific endonuclease VapC